MTKEQYRAARREARKNRRLGLWLRNPVRAVDGFPGEFVGADGQVFGFYGFERMFEPLERTDRHDT